MKALKIFGMTILACSVLFVSCKKDENKSGTSTTSASYTITVKANDDAMGTVTGGGTYKAKETATLTATANTGFRFVKWQDGNTDNPRKVTVTANAEYTATFEVLPAEQFTITVNANDATMGTVTGGGSYTAGATATLTATANVGYRFVSWQDGNTDNPRTITVTADASYTANFEAQASGSGITVTFDGINWTAAGIQGTYYSSTGVYDICAGEDAALSSFPIADVCSYKITTGSESDTYDESNGWTNEVFAYLEYYEEYSLQSQSGYTYGDWWGKTATMNVGAFDATALTLSASVNAVMFSAYEAYINQVGMAAAPTANMSVNINNVQLEASSSKASLKKSFNGKLRVK